MKLISKSELKELLKASERLARLDAFGVSECYPNALAANESFGKDFDTWVDVDLDDLLKEYPDYTVSNDNFNFD